MDEVLVAALDAYNADGWLWKQGDASFEPALMSSRRGMATVFQA
jgi:hypothetical protein